MTKVMLRRWPTSSMRRFPYSIILVFSGIRLHSLAGLSPNIRLGHECEFTQFTVVSPAGPVALNAPGQLFDAA
jgi:hypothetical protein